MELQWAFLEHVHELLSMMDGKDVAKNSTQILTLSIGMDKFILSLAIFSYPHCHLRPLGFLAFPVWWG